jgi:hypothetical protein
MDEETNVRVSRGAIQSNGRRLTQQRALLLELIEGADGHLGADESPLSQVLDDANHGAAINLPEAARRRIYLWLDANAPFYGTYSKAEQLAQRNGEAVPPPRAQ